MRAARGAIMSEWMMEPKLFDGTIGAGGRDVEVKFTAGLDKAGALDIEFERFPLDRRSAFISEHAHVSGTKFSKFVLLGCSSDGTLFECDNLVLTSLKSETDFAVCERTTIAPQVGYSQARFIMSAEPVAAPLVKWHLRGFESFRALSASCSLGVVEMAGLADARGVDCITGALVVRAESPPPDLAEWRAKVDDLCIDVRHVMSFALSTLFGGPVREFRSEDKSVIDVFLNSGGGDPSFPVFSSLSLEAIFDCAVRWHFEPPIDVKNLTFAIKWFCMKASYREGALITAMTVLENLIDSNLPEAETHILDDDRFKALRKALSDEIKRQAAEWTNDPLEQKAYADEMCPKLSELRRRSLVDKISLLAERWAVSLDGIPSGAVQEAKRARDHVVHRGHHQPKKGSTRDLHDHVLAIREVVVRFVLAAVGFEGNYLSYLDGQNFAVLRKIKIGDVTWHGFSSHASRNQT